jgi:hypothetical protein
MSTLTPESFPDACNPIPATAEGEDARLAEAACYAVLGRVLPILRHDVAGSLQPVQMLLMVLERRVQSTHPDLAAIAKSVMSLSALTKQAAADCMSALTWTDSREDLHVSLRAGVDEAARLLGMEMSENALVLVNGIADDSATAPQSALRTVVMGALLAFCDQRVAGSTLEVTFHEAASDSQHTGRLQMQMLPGDAGKSPASLDGMRKPRAIGWADVQAMADSCSVKMAHGDGWLTLDLPRR